MIAFKFKINKRQYRFAHKNGLMQCFPFLISRKKNVYITDIKTFD
jgi:hypothetical protein